MKAPFLALAALAAGSLAAMPAHAVIASPNHQGEVLLFPYYNVNEGNLSLIGVANRTDQVKALKVRFREGMEGEAVLDFQLWLSPHDHWTAVLRQVDGGVLLATSDTSCTLPTIKDNPNARFRTDRIADFFAGSRALERISEGHVEIIEMASVSVVPGTVLPQLATSVTHIDGVPANCSALSRFNAGRLVIRIPGDYESFAVTGHFDEPTGGLYGIAAVFNPASGTYFTYTAEALADLAVTPIFYPQDSAVYEPGSDHTADASLASISYIDLPDLSTPDSFDGAATVAVINSRTFTDTGQTTVGTYTTDARGVVSTLGPPSGTNAAQKKRDAVSTALMSQSLVNDYLSGPRYDTDWVFSLPTRYLYRGPVNPVTRSYVMSPPFESEVDRVTGRGCEDLSESVFHGREEERSTSTDREPLSLCYAVNVFAVSDETTAPASTSALASIAVRADAVSTETFGWADLALGDHLLVDDANVTHVGLPTLGFAAITDRSTGITRSGVYSHQITRGVTR